MDIQDKFNRYVSLGKRDSVLESELRQDLRRKGLDLSDLKFDEVLIDFIVKEVNKMLPNDYCIKLTKIGWNTYYSAYFDDLKSEDYEFTCINNGQNSHPEYTFRVYKRIYNNFDSFRLCRCNKMHIREGEYTPLHIVIVSNEYDKNSRPSEDRNIHKYINCPTNRDKIMENIGTLVDYLMREEFTGDTFRL